MYHDFLMDGSSIKFLRIHISHNLSVAHRGFATKRWTNIPTNKLQLISFRVYVQMVSKMCRKVNDRYPKIFCQHRSPTGTVLRRGYVEPDMEFRISPSHCKQQPNQQRNNNNSQINNETTTKSTTTRNNNNKQINNNNNQDTTTKQQQQPNNNNRHNNQINNNTKQQQQTNQQQQQPTQQ